MRNDAVGFWLQVRHAAEGFICSGKQDDLLSLRLRAAP